MPTIHKIITGKDIPMGNVYRYRIAMLMTAKRAQTYTVRGPPLPE